MKIAILHDEETFDLSILSILTSTLIQRRQYLAAHDNCNLRLFRGLLDTGMLHTIYSGHTFAIISCAPLTWTYSALICSHQAWSTSLTVQFFNAGAIFGNPGRTSRPVSLRFHSSNIHLNCAAFPYPLYLCSRDFRCVPTLSLSRLSLCLPPPPGETSPRNTIV